MIEQEQFDTICFYKSCINSGQQIFHSVNSSKAHSKHKQGYCRRMQAQQMEPLFKLPASIIRDLMKGFKKKIDKQLKSQRGKVQRVFKINYAGQANRFGKMCIKEFTYGQCQNMLKKLRRKSRGSRIDYKEILTDLFLKQKDKILREIERKLALVSNEFKEVSQTILQGFQSKIVEVFASKFDIDGVKYEQMSQSSNSNQMMIEIPEEPSMRQPELSDSLPTQNAANLLPRQQAKKTKKQRKIEEDAELLIHTKRRHKKQNYAVFHSEGQKDPPKQYFQINSIDDAILILQEKQFESQNATLVIKCPLDIKTLKNIIKCVKPIKIYLNSQINATFQKILKSIPKDILNNLVEFQEDWQYNLFFKEYASTLFFPTQQNRPLARQKQKISEIYKKSPNLHNLIIRDEQDIIEINKNIPNLQSITSLKIQQYQVSSKAIGVLLPKFRSIKTLVLKDITLNEVFIDIIRRISQTKLQCLILLNIDGVTQDFLDFILTLNLRKLLLHKKQFGLLSSFHKIICNQNLQYLSIKNLYFDQFEQDEDLTRRINKRRLKHLDIHDGGIQISKIIKYLNKNTLQYLNLSQTPFQQYPNKLNDFANIKELNLDYTQFHLKDFLQELGQSMKNLEKISLLGFQDQRYPFQAKDYFLSDQEISLICSQNNKLKYLNLSCESSVRKILQNGKNNQFDLYLNGVKKSK